MSAKHITGIIGYPLSHTLSPVMHNAVFKKYNMDWEYRVYETKPEDVGAMLGNMRKQGIRGINVTIPYKQVVMQYLDKTDKAAAAIGAVNTVVNKKGRLTGYNTDYIGFGETLKKNKIGLKGKTVIMLGAGGAAHALAYMINMQKPARFYIYNIDLPMIHRLVKKLKLKKVITGDISNSEEKNRIFASADLIINATSVGQHDRNVPYKLDRLKKGAVVYDIIYNPAMTEFLKLAQKKGAKVINGLDMLIYQGMHSFKLWTGRKSDYRTIMKALKKFFNGKL
jgi:shikimate dehydrogenase